VVKKFLVVRRVSNLFVLTLLFCLPVFSQSKSAFGTLSVSSDQNQPKEITRPRLINSSSSTESDNSANSTKNKPVAVSAQLTKLEREIFEILNQKRQEKGLSPLTWSEDMAKVARQHSNNMAEQKFFSHIGKDGLLVSDRADALGFSYWRAIGENIAFNQGYDKPAEFACERWLLSPSHRNNILNRSWKETGVGVAIAENGAYYFTQVFVQK
jgi:uncharacterized protein YkwD